MLEPAGAQTSDEVLVGELWNRAAGWEHGAEEGRVCWAH